MVRINNVPPVVEEVRMEEQKSEQEIVVGLREEVEGLQNELAEKEEENEELDKLVGKGIENLEKERKEKRELQENNKKHKRIRLLSLLGRKWSLDKVFKSNVKICKLEKEIDKKNKELVDLKNQLTKEKERADNLQAELDKEKGGGDKGMNDKELTDSYRLTFDLQRREHIIKGEDFSFPETIIHYSYHSLRGDTLDFHVKNVHDPRNAYCNKGEQNFLNLKKVLKKLSEYYKNKE